MKKIPWTILWLLIVRDVCDVIEVIELAHKFIGPVFEMQTVIVIIEVYIFCKVWLCCVLYNAILCHVLASFAKHLQVNYLLLQLWFVWFYVFFLKKANPYLSPESYVLLLHLKVTLWHISTVSSNIYVGVKTAVQMPVENSISSP